MTTLFGIPLFGTFFLPLILGIATVFFFWTFIFSRKSLHSTAEDEDVANSKLSVPKEKVFLETKRNAKVKEKKKCGSSGGCCSKKNGKSSGCSDLNQAIHSAKVFLDAESNICQVCKVCHPCYNFSKQTFCFSMHFLSCCFRNLLKF